GTTRKPLLRTGLRTLCGPPRPGTLTAVATVPGVCPMSALPACWPELLVLLSEVKTDPDDDTPRLILADWLQDHDDPRGEFIHLQVVRRSLSEDDPRHAPLYQRERQILSRHGLDWLGPLADHAGSWTFT